MFLFLAEQMSHLFGYKEVDDFLLDADAEGTGRGLHEATVDSNHCFPGFVDEDFASAVGMDGTVVQEAARYQKPDALNELHHFGMIDHRDVEHAVVGHGVGCLSIAGA